MNAVVSQLKNRHIIQVATVYGVTAWPMLQIADLLVPALGLPDSVMALLLASFVVGFPIVLAFAMLFNVSSHGVVWAGNRGDAEEASTGGSRYGMHIAVVCIMFLIVISVFSVEYFWGDKPSGTSVAPPLAPTVLPVSQANVEADPSIAVLPFVSFSNDPNDEYFADGMVEELLNVLARFKGLRVTARTSSFAYKGVTNKSIAEIGKEIGVATILEGSVRRNDVNNSIRVTAQLIDVESGDHIWSETFDREYRDVFQIQDDIAKAVGQRLQSTLLGTEQAPVVARAETRNVNAMIAYGRGQKEMAHRTVPSLTRALELFTEATENDPQYARAWVGQADASVLLSLYGDLDHAKAREDAQSAIDRALSIDPDFAAAHASQGLLHSVAHSAESRALAKQSLERAIQLNPNYAPAYNWYGSIIDKEGDQDRAMSYFRKAVQLDPKSAVAANNVAGLYFRLGDESNAMEMFAKTIDSDPFYPGAYNLVGEIVRERGNLNGAIDMYDRALNVDPTNKDAVKGLMIVSMDMGNFDEAEYWYEYLQREDVAATNWEIKLLHARMFMARGEPEAGLAALKEVTEFNGMEAMDTFVSGEAAYYSADYDTAIAHYEQLRDAANTMGFNFLTFPGDSDAALHLANSYLQIGQVRKGQAIVEEMETFLQQLNEAQKDSAEFLYTMSLIRTLQGNQDESLLYMQAALDSGWTQTWKLKFEPILQPMHGDQHLPQMVAALEQRLATMRSEMVVARVDTQSTTSFDF